MVLVGKMPMLILCYNGCNCALFMVCLLRSPAMLQANFAFRKVHFARDLARVRVTDFFGGVASAILLHKVRFYEWVSQLDH